MARWSRGWGVCVCRSEGQAKGTFYSTWSHPALLRLGDVRWPQRLCSALGRLSQAGRRMQGWERGGCHERTRPDRHPPGILSPPGRDGLGEGAAHPAHPSQGSLTRCQKSPSPRSSFPHRDPLRRWRSNSRRGSSGSGGTEGRRAAVAVVAAAGGAHGQRLGGLTMVDASPGAAPREPGSPATPAGGRRRRARPWRPQRFAAPRPGATPRRRGRAGGRASGRAAGAGRDAAGG